jgi:neurotransmitter:Na+ symporter, NSS family
MEEQRGNWSSSLGFILAATGSAIGLGNLWKFPFITWENDGGAFVLVYLMCIAAVGLPIMMAELLMGRKTQKSAVGAFKDAVGPLWGLVGGWGVLCGFILLSYYSIIAGWSLLYFKKTVGWSISGFSSQISMGDMFGQQVSNGGLQILLSGLFMIATVGVVYFGVQKGIEKVARVFLPILFGILLLLMVSALSMDGAGQALKFIFEPDFGSLKAEGILEALGHSFFTLSLGMGAMITFGSYIDKNQSIVKASAVIVILDTLIALMATVIMFSVIFSVPGMPEQVGGSTVGMLFISLPELFYTEVPFGRLLGPLFYVLVALAALTSTVSLLEVVAAYLIDEHKIARHRAVLICGGSIFVFTIIAGLSFGAVPALSSFELFAGKQGWFSNADHFVSNWMLPTGGLAVTIAVGWMMTREATKAELVDGNEPRWFHYGAWRFFIRYVAPVAVASIIIAVLFFGVDFS